MGTRSDEQRRRGAPILLGEPGTAEQLAEVARQVSLVFGSMGVLALVVTAIVVTGPADSRPQGYHPLAIALLAPVSIAVAGLALRRPDLFSPATLTYLVPVFIVVFAATGWLVGPEVAPLLGMFLAWFANPITYLPRRVTVIHMMWLGVVYAVFLALQPGNFLPLVRWEIIVGATLATAVVMNRLVERARALARGEQAARAEAEQDRAELEVVSAHKSRFLARMSHELRTPLNAIIGFSQVLAQRSFGPLEPKQVEYVNDVVDSGRHLLALVDDLLDLAKVETGVLELQPGRVELANLLAGSLALFQEQAGRHQVALVLDAGPELGVIEADARKLKQVVFNLLANAVRFTPPGGRVTLGARRTGERVDIWVADTGPGIAAEDREAIFEEFRQSAGAGPGGTGLGLPLARRLVEAHGGHLQLHSQPGMGSRFTVELPVRARPGATTEGASPPAEERPVRLVVGEPDSPERRVETARLLVILGAAAIGVATLAMVILRLHPVPEVAPFEVGNFAFGLAAIALAVVSVSAVAAWPQWMAAPRTMPYLGVLLVIGIGMAVYGMGPEMGTYAAVFYGWGGVSAFLLLTPRQGIVQLLLIGVGYATVLALQDGNALPVARWLVVMEFVVVSGLMWGRLVARIQALALAERAARQEAERVRSQLELASRHKTEFLANMSHELRTPLNVIIGFSEVLATQAFGPLNPKQSDYVADVLASGRHLLGLINDILDLAKADAGRMELHTAEIDPEAMLASVLLPFQEDACRRGIELCLEVGATLGPIEVDEAKLGQALGRLLDNAIKFTPDGGRVTLRAARDTDHVEITVIDTGRGIDPAVHQRIFDAFALGDSPATEHGSGLGLALARRYAELHGGSLTVRSDVGRGATFTMRLPVRAATVVSVS